MSEEIVMFEGSQVRIAGDLSAPLFCAADVCALLGHSNPSVALETLDPDERAKLSLGHRLNTNYITESGLYHLIFKSRKASARKFRRWVTEEVLPSLRKKGFYSHLRGSALITLPEWLDLQEIDVSREKAKAKRLLAKAWEASKLLGYRSLQIEEESGLVRFPTKVLALAEDGDLEEAIMNLPDHHADHVRQLMEAMEPGRDYAVNEIAKLAGMTGTAARIVSDVGQLMRRLEGAEWHGCSLIREKRNRRVFYRLQPMEGGADE